MSEKNEKRVITYLAVMIVLHLKPETQFTVPDLFGNVWDSLLMGGQNKGNIGIEFVKWAKNNDAIVAILDDVPDEPIRNRYMVAS